MLWVGGAVWVLVVALLLIALFRQRGEEPLEALSLTAQQSLGARAWIIGGGIVMPVVVLLGLIILTVGALRLMAATTPSDEVVIEVIGHQWWWEVRYLNQNVITANELHLPVGQPLEIKLTSVDVIHSFWVPELHGKFDLIPGRTNRFVLQADQPGEYRGQCAEFCGLQHAKMAILVVAQAPEDFMAWLDQQAQPAPQPTEPAALAGRQIFLESACRECHTIRGVSASNGAGPDLTHLAGRRTLAAGTRLNTPEHLAEWISAPQAVKPGNLMPETSLTPEELSSLLAYLESLK